ncbi:hypothetical protein TNCV_1820161 [Trichonephila clavipes]|nr:hypothetical protein TNCV_1820161 [Trichonephila clavipes]
MKMMVLRKGLTQVGICVSQALGLFRTLPPRCGGCGGARYATGLTPNEIANFMRELSENELDDGRRLHMVREARGPNEDATLCLDGGRGSSWLYARISYDGAVLSSTTGYRRAFEPDLHLNAISWIHWSQHLPSQHN